MLSVATVRVSIVALTTALVLSSACDFVLAQSGSRSGMGGGMGGGPNPAGPQKQARYVPPKFAPAGPRINVAEVRLKGSYSVSDSRIRAKLQTREGRQFDPASVQADVRQLTAQGLCYDVRTYREDSPDGVIITFELFEQFTLDISLQSRPITVLDRFVSIN